MSVLFGFNCSKIMEAITSSPPSICSGANVSLKKIAAMTPALIGSRVAVILACVARMRLMPSKYSPNGKIVPQVAINKIHNHSTVK